MKKIMLTKMRKYGIQSSILTMLEMERLKLVTKETVEKAYKGELENYFHWEDFGPPHYTINYGASINDDLERFFIKLKNQKEVEDEDVFSFFPPKLTNKELKLVEEGNKEHLKSYEAHYKAFGVNPDVDVEEMKKSDSKSKYVHVRCRRLTIPLILASEETDDSKETDDFDESVYSDETNDSLMILSDDSLNNLHFNS